LCGSWRGPRDRRVAGWRLHCSGATIIRASREVNDAALQDPTKDREFWIIVRNVKLVDASGIRGTLGRDASRLRETYEFWTGERWWDGGGGKRPEFATEEEAQRYIDENLALLRE